MSTLFRRCLQTASGPLKATVRATPFTPLRVQPERIFIAATPHVPNSKLPVLVYRSVLQGLSRDEILGHIQSNNWLKGDKSTPNHTAYFHSNTHECFAVLKGESVMSLGKSPLDWDVNGEGLEIGKRVRISQGDLFVLPAGVSRCSIESNGDYECVAFYPKGFPEGDRHLCKQEPEIIQQRAADCNKVPIPDVDPVYGASGPLTKLWKSKQI